MRITELGEVGDRRVDEKLHERNIRCLVTMVPVNNICISPVRC